MKIFKNILIGTLTVIATLAVLGLNGLGVPVELVPMIGGSLFVGTKSITRIKG